jgi:hypothetical protein
MYSFLEKCMHGVDDNCVHNSAATLLVNHIQILVCLSPGTLGTSFVMLHEARGIVTTWCSKVVTKRTRCLILQLRYYPAIAALSGKVLDNEPH